jgi:hypothetical protein
MIEKTGKVASAVVTGLTAQGPLALPLVVINCVCLAIVAYVLYQVSDASQRRDALITELAKSCQPIMPR